MKNRCFAFKLLVMTTTGIVFGGLGMNVTGSELSSQERSYSWGESKEGFLLGINVEKQSVSVRDPVILNVVLKNISDTPLPLVQTRPENDYRVSVHYENGEAVPLTLYGKRLDSIRGEVRRRTTVTLASNEALEHHLHIDRLFDMSLTGKYFIKVTRTMLTRGTNGFADLESNRLCITVMDSARQ